MVEIYLQGEVPADVNGCDFFSRVFWDLRP